MSNINFILEQLNVVLNDKLTPRNIKRAVENAINILNDQEKEEKVKVAQALNQIESIIDDPNMPLYIRTLLLQITAALSEMMNKD